MPDCRDERLVKQVHRVVAALMTVLSVKACGTADGPGPAPSPGALSIEEFDALHSARIADARAVFTEADVQFMTGMIIHHAQALVMSAWAPENEASSEVRTLAARIFSSQQDEIARMQEWLSDRDQPVPEARMRGGELVHGARHIMPGMLTNAQMAELGQARGHEFDRLFLAYMIQHHRGALIMVEELFASQGAAQANQIFKFASDINVDQATEIARMQGMLEAMSAASAGAR